MVLRIGPLVRGFIICVMVFWHYSDMSFKLGKSMKSNSLMSPIAIRALEKALQAARVPPKSRVRVDSRIADKFVVRAYSELLQELAAIGVHEGRSANSEIVSGILEALAGYERSNATTRILRAALGEEVAEQVLAEVPTFEIALCTHPRKFVIRFPATVRETIRVGVKNVESIDDAIPQRSMNKWLLDSMVAWVNIQRTQYALLSAVVAHEKALEGKGKERQQAETAGS